MTPSELRRPTRSAPQDPAYVVGTSGDDVEVPDKRMLLITRRYPPGQNAAVLRWQKLTRHAWRHGWGVDVVTRDPAEMDNPDWDRVDDLPPGTTVYGVPVPPSTLDRAVDWVIGLVPSWIRARCGRASSTLEDGPPDRQAGDDLDGRDEASSRDESRRSRWLSAAVQELRGLYEGLLPYLVGHKWNRRVTPLCSAVFEPGRHRVIITSGPPHAVHLAVPALARRFDIPVVMDTQDPWSVAHRYSGPVASWTLDAVESFLERRTLRAADRVIVNTEVLREKMRDAHPEAGDKLVTVANAYDPEEVPDEPEPGEDAPFRIAYTGAIYIDRDPRPFFEAARRAIDATGAAPGDFRIEFVTWTQALNGRPLTKVAADHGLEDFAHFHGARPRAEAMRFVARATMLLSLPQSMDTAIPSKIFDYMLVHAWMLVMSDEGSATERMLRDTRADIVQGRDVERMATVIERRYRSYRAGVRPPRIADDAPQLSRAHQAERLFREMDTWA